MKNYQLKTVITLFVTMFFLMSCNQQGDKMIEIQKTDSEQKTGVLLVNHGSRSETWRNSLLDLEDSVRDEIMKSGKIKGIKTAHMEYTEPSIATRLKEFDKEGYTDVIVVPIFLTVSSHSFDDIPTLVGLKDDPQSIEDFKIENIERYLPKAKMSVTPALDFTDIIIHNVLNRFNMLSDDAENEGLVLIAYGDENYNEEWSELMEQIGDFVEDNTALSKYSYGWCGHLVKYEPKFTTNAIKEVLKEKEKAVVVPILVAYDEMFQGDIIKRGVEAISDYQNKVIYKQDAILPDKNVEKWVIDVVEVHIDKIENVEINEDKK